ncbi:MAG: hypothetical protein U0103_08110 [Candidatus Obscuribacterales bacterium]|nr:hypothetical protein [Cyanobacteria bacterium SZAS LIN-5]RTL39256.1 MAG: hypothetical protein EKK48_19620 [Candidatus Melainabacteria bacterium]
MTQSDLNQVIAEPAVPMPLDLAQEFSSKRQAAETAIKGLIAAAIVNVLAIIALIIFVEPLFAGKVVLIEVMFAISAVCLVIVIGHNKIMSLLTQAEEIAYFARDQAFIDLNTLREELVRLRHKVRRDVDAEGYGHVNELLKMVSPLVMMFIQKEKNVLRWGMFGWKIAQNAMAIIKQRSKQQ